MWYDVFSRFYDASIERLYRSARAELAARLDLAGTEDVLIVPVGTGQDLDVLGPRLPEGRILGVDLSEGMLARARKRVERLGLTGVTLRASDVHAVDEALLQEALGRPDVDGIVVTLGLSAFPEWEAAFAGLWDRLAPGGWLAILDVYAQSRIAQTAWVEMVARADLNRQTWRPLEEAAEAFDIRWLDEDPRVHGGSVYVAVGRKPTSA